MASVYDRAKAAGFKITNTTNPNDYTTAPLLQPAKPVNWAEEYAKRQPVPVSPAPIATGPNPIQNDGKSYGPGSRTGDEQDLLDEVPSGDDPLDPAGDVAPPAPEAIPDEGDPLEAPAAPGAWKIDPNRNPFMPAPVPSNIQAGQSDSAGTNIQEARLQGEGAEAYSDTQANALRTVQGANRGFSGEMAELLKSKKEYEGEQENALMKRLNANRNAQFWDKMIGAIGQATAGLVGMKTGLNVGGNYKYEPQYDRAYEDTAATNDYTRRLGQWKAQQETAISNALQAKKITEDEAAMQLKSLDAIVENTTSKATRTAANTQNSTEAANQEERDSAALQKYYKDNWDILSDREKLDVMRLEKSGAAKEKERKGTQSWVVPTGDTSWQDTIKQKRLELIGDAKQKGRLAMLDAAKTPEQYARVLTELQLQPHAAAALANEAFAAHPGSDMVSVQKRRALTQGIVEDQLTRMSNVYTLTRPGSDLRNWNIGAPQLLNGDTKETYDFEPQLRGEAVTDEEVAPAPMQNTQSGPQAPVQQGRGAARVNPQYAALVESSYPTGANLTPTDQRAKSFYNDIPAREGVEFSLYQGISKKANKSKLWLTGIIMDTKQEMAYYKQYQAARKAGDEAGKVAAVKGIMDWEYNAHMYELEGIIQKNPKVGAYLESNGGLKRLALQEQAWHSGPGEDSYRNSLRDIQNEMSKPAPDINALDRRVAQRLAAYVPPSGIEAERKRSDFRAARFLEAPQPAPQPQPQQQPTPVAQQPAQQPAPVAQQPNTFKPQPIGSESASLSQNMPALAGGFVATGIGTYAHPQKGLFTAFEFKDKDGNVKHEILNPSVNLVQDVPELQNILPGYTRVGMINGKLVYGKPMGDLTDGQLLPQHMVPKVIKAMYSQYLKEGKPPFSLYYPIKPSVGGAK